MRVALAGGTGFIGGHLLRALLGAGHEVRALYGPGRCPDYESPGLRWIEGLWDRHGLPPALFERCDAAINAVGLLREAGGRTFAKVHVAGALAFFEAARVAGGRRLLQLSALGADPGATEAFLRSKGEADRRLLEVGDVAVFRPSVVYGEGDLSMARLSALAHWPLVPLPGRGAMRLQPLWVGDLAEAMVHWMEDSKASGGVYELGGPEALTLRDILGLLRGREARFLPLPDGLMDVAARVGGWVGHPLLQPEAWAMLRAGSVCDSAPLRRLLGREAVPFREGVRLRGRRL